MLSIVDACDLDAPGVLVEALVIAEDRRYWFHLGVDPWAILRSVYRCAFRGRIEGASTIEAQLFRVISGRKEITLSRKLREALGAFSIAVLRSKKRVALAYLDSAYFGYREHGVRFAATKCSIDAFACTVAEAAVLVSLIKRPVVREVFEANDLKLRKRSKWVEAKLTMRMSHKVPTGEAV